MIVFEGYLSGKANKYFINKMLKRGCSYTVICLICTIPVWFFVSYKIGAVYEVMFALLLLIVISPFIACICITQKTRQKINLKKVIIKDDIIKAISDKYKISNDLSMVREVRDYGEFYDVMLSPLYFTSVYVCQKNMISKGSIKEFEMIFSDKIKRMDKTD